MDRTGKNNPNWKGGIGKSYCDICSIRIKHKAKRCIKHVDKNGANNPKWRGGTPKTYEGYVQIYSPHHPYKNNYGYVLEHRLVMEKEIGRYLERSEVVHHINSIRDDNRIDNLILFKNASEHRKHHVAINK